MSKLTLPDIQATPDDRGWEIDEVGVCNIVYPIKVKTKPGLPLHTIATIKMGVSLSKEEKGTHMSRFIEGLEEYTDFIQPMQSTEIIVNMIEKLKAESGMMELKFPYFMDKVTPVTKKNCLASYGVTFQIQSDKDGNTLFNIGVEVLVNSLCPCSKKISDYGAHNQRSRVTVIIQPKDGEFFWFEDLIKMIERNGSVELFPLLKREDEKWVTEKMYDNPKFVEDIIRDIAIELDDMPIDWFSVTSVNEESIHMHDAFGKIERGTRSKKFLF